MATVYSVRFMAEVHYEGTVEYEVPAGYRAVIRDLDGYMPAPIDQDIELYLIGPANNTIYWQQADIDTTVLANWRGRQVYNAGEEIKVITTYPCDFQLSGYLLTLP